MQARRSHAIVIGASVAGQLAAHVLSKHYERVTILERDVSTASVEHRKGVPQSRHLHVLLAGGLLAIERLLPGFRARAIECGAVAVDVGDFGTLYLAGALIPPMRTGLSSLMLSRPLLDRCIRERLTDNPKIHLREGVSVQRLLGTAQAVRGVVVRSNEAERALEQLPADLVIDASGRGSRVPTWLQELGVEAPREERVVSNVQYASCTIARRPEHLNGRACWVMTPVPGELRFGAALAIEGGRYIITLTTYCNEPTPTTWEGFVAYARTLRFQGLDTLLENAEPLTDPVHMRDPQSRRRHYEKLTRFPSGLLVMGDALCAFNPAYGQGMSVAALEAEALDHCLGVDGELRRRFFRAAAKIVDVPWQLATGSDFQWPAVQGVRPLGTAQLNAYVARVIAAAGHSPRVALSLLRVMHLLAPPTILFAPHVVLRALLGKRTPPAPRVRLPANSDEPTHAHSLAQSARDNITADAP